MSDTTVFTNIELPVSDIPTASTLEFEAIEPRYRTVALAGWFTIWVAAIAVNVGINALTGSFSRMAESSLAPWIIGTLGAIAVIGFIIPTILWRTKGYRLRDNDVHYKHGIIWRQVTSLPYARIQHVELESGPIERISKLTTLKFYSAGGGSADMKIPGLSFVTASKIRAFVMNRISENADVLPHTNNEAPA